VTNPQHNNLSEADPERVAEQGLDPLTDVRTTAQTPTDDEQISALPNSVRDDGSEYRTGDYDPTTGAAHPAEGSGADKGDESLGQRLAEKIPGEKSRETERRAEGKTSNVTSRERSEGTRPEDQRR
jgi:hypothetical protein